MTYNKSIKSLHFFDKTIGAKTCKWLCEVLAAVDIEKFDFELQMRMPNEEVEARQRPGSPTPSMLVEGSWLSLLAAEREEQERMAAEEEDAAAGRESDTLQRQGPTLMKKGAVVGKGSSSPTTTNPPSRDSVQATMVRRGVNAEK